jgi:hypothetical protein
MAQTQASTSGTVQPGVELALQQLLTGGGKLHCAPHSATAWATHTSSNPLEQHAKSVAHTQSWTG